LYDVLGLPVQKHKKTRRPTIDSDAIALLRNQVGVAPDEREEEDGLTYEEALQRISLGADPILEARVLYAGALQIQSHYLEPARKALADGDGRFYPDQLIHAQASGRWSTNDPPLAQLPSDLRDIVCADPGTVWLGWDWDQIELRINAALSGDAPSIEAFAQDWDIHTLNACDLFGLPYPPNRVDPHTAEDAAVWRELVRWQGKDDLRRVFAKRFVYRLDYGGDPARAGDVPGAKVLGLTSSLLVRASNRYLAQHPQKAEWRRQIATEATTTRISRTFAGRRRRLLGDGKKAIREAFNQPMQGGVVDIFNTTFIQLKDACPWLEWAYGMHDSQNWACPVGRVTETLPKLRSIIEQEWDIAGIKTRFPATYKPKELFAK
jgi:DNA polymerase-1